MRLFEGRYGLNGGGFLVFSILVALGVLGVLILVHELGHFAAARWLDIRVPRFSIGLGPRIFGFRRGETEYRLSAFPLGGYVKIAGLEEMSALEGGDDGESGTDPDRNFESKSAAGRALVLGAGVAMNALLAVLLFAAVAGIWGVPVPAGPVVGNVVEEWLPPGAAALAGVRPGARITAIGDRRITTMDEAARALMAAPAGPLTLHFANRPAVTIDIPRQASSRRFLPLALEPVSDAGAGHPARVRKAPLAALGWGVSQSRYIISLMGDFASGLFDGRHSARELGGPILIGQLSGATARAGLPVFLMFVATLSINLALVNFLPIPALDGGHLLFLLVEVVRGKPAPRRVRVAVGRAGVALVAMLMVWAVTSDVMRVLGL